MVYRAARNVLSKPRSKSARKAKVKKTMDEWKAGGLHSGSKKGPIVKSRKQAGMSKR